MTQRKIKGLKKKKVDLQEMSSALALRPVRTFRDFISEMLPEVVETLVTQVRPGTDSNRSWQPIKHTSKRPKEKRFSH